MTKYRIVLADDHQLVREGVKTILKKFKNYVIVGEASSGTEAVEMYRKLKPDILLVDISMPGLNGMLVTKAIIDEYPDAKIIILSTYDDEDYINKCIEFGAKGYVVKSESSTELSFAIGLVLDGRTYFSAAVQQVIINQYANTATKKTKSQPLIHLTPREHEIVKLIAASFTSQQIAERLFISVRTVETHRANLMKKVGAKNSIDLVKILEKGGFL